MIRKPGAAEQASPLRRVAEAGLVMGGQRARPGSISEQHGLGTVKKSTVAWLLGIFLFGLITASSGGARLLGILTLVPVGYVAWRWYKRSTTGAREVGQQGPLARNFERAGDLVTLLVPHPLDALDIITDKLERREDEEESARARRVDTGRGSTSPASEPFDADKAFARYLAGKEARTSAPEPAPTPSSAIPPRTFGRRTH